ncbi:pseudouridine synthase [Lipomyces arxii]|uniref:pseudouridine synthase n=1 Tax=Lipomyces arxii TaxID=56418 RepID=UPI0034D012E5
MNEKKRSADQSLPESSSRQFYPSHTKQYDLAGFRVRRQALDAKQSTLGEVLGQSQEEGTKHYKTVTIHDEVSQGAQYVLGDGLRKVPPYYFTYLTYCKERWRNKNILDVFVNEFRDRDAGYYKQALDSGRVTLNGKIATADSIIRNGDRISHRIHRHEPPVTAKPVNIVFQDDDIIAINKPSGVPVHPTGRYRFNTVTEIMKHEMGLAVHPCHRLDRLTSGIMFMARTAKAAQKMSERLRERTVYKEYVARVIGEFPDGEVTCDMPVLTVDPKLGLNRVKLDGGKAATTIFNRISYNGTASVVKCRPLTGRTHQIRVHLQFLGHPIANDPIYANRRVFGPDLGKSGAGSDDDIVVKLARMGKYDEAMSVAYEELLEESKRSEGEKLSGEKCEICETDLYTDPGLNDLELWLHAQKYGSKTEKWEYQTELPDWAAKDFKGRLSL